MDRWASLLAIDRADRRGDRSSFARCPHLRIEMWGTRHLGLWIELFFYFFWVFGSFVRSRTKSRKARSFAGGR